MSYFDDNEDYLIHRLGYNSFKRKPTRPRVEVTADDFEDLGPAEPAQADTAEGLLREAVHIDNPYYSPRGAKHGDLWCWFCGRPKTQWEFEAPGNHKVDCTWLRTRRLFSVEDLL